jgi:hypothetical protein
MAATQSVGTTSQPAPGIRDDTGVFPARVVRLRELEHVDLAGDVEVMRFRVGARVEHRARGGGKRAGAMQHGGHAVERLFEPGAVVERDDARFEAELIWRGVRSFPALRPASTGL